MTAPVDASPATGLGRGPMDETRTELSRELHARADSQASAGLETVLLGISEARAVADAFDAQHGLMATLAQERDQLAEGLDRARLALRLSRTFALNPIIMPQQDEVRAFLRDYLDHGNLAPIPWPTQLPAVARFLHDAGYINVRGAVHPCARLKREEP